MKHKLLWTLAAAGVATAVMASRRRNRAFVAPLVPDEWRTDPDDYFDSDTISTRNAGAPVGGASLDEQDAAAEALGLVVAVDELAIEAAERVLERPDLDPDVRRFADTVLSEHSTSLAAAQALDIAPQTSAEVADLRARRAARLREIDSLHGQELERAYLESLVEGHREALRMLDRLSPDADDDDVRDHLAGTRAHLTQHLNRGRELLAQV